MSLKLKTTLEETRADSGPIIYRCGHLDGEHCVTRGETCEYLTCEGALSLAFLDCLDRRKIFKVRTPEPKEEHSKIRILKPLLR